MRTTTRWIGTVVLGTMLACLAPRPSLRAIRPVTFSS